MNASFPTHLCRNEMPHSIARDCNVRSTLPLVCDEHINGPVHSPQPRIAINTANPTAYSAR